MISYRMHMIKYARSTCQEKFLELALIKILLGRRQTFRYTLDGSLDRLCFRRSPDQEVGLGAGRSAFA